MSLHKEEIILFPTIPLEARSSWESISRGLQFWPRQAVPRKKGLTGTCRREYRLPMRSCPWELTGSPVPQQQLSSPEGIKHWDKMWGSTDPSAWGAARAAWGAQAGVSLFSRLPSRHSPGGFTSFHGSCPAAVQDNYSGRGWMCEHGCWKTSFGTLVIRVIKLGTPWPILLFC